jgi:hypothetical protein
MSLEMRLGARGNLLDPNGGSYKQVRGEAPAEQQQQQSAACGRTAAPRGPHMSSLL